MPLELDNKHFSYKPDKKDLKLIEYISDNARDPYVRIGKAIGISKDRVRERLKCLDEQVFIHSYFPLINYAKLGLMVHHVLIRIKDLNEFNEVIASFSHSPYVTSIITTVGKFDLYIKILSKRESDMKKIFYDIIGTNHQYVEFLELFQLDRYSMKIHSDYDKSLYGGTETIDELDQEILASLSENCRKSLVEMSTELKQYSVDVLRYRLKILTSKGIILKYHARTNKHRLGLITYIVFLDLKDYSKISFFSEFHNIYYSAKMKGKYNYLIHFHCKNVIELYNMIKHLRIILQELLIDFEVLTILDRDYFSPFNKHIKL